MNKKVKYEIAIKITSLSYLKRRENHLTKFWIHIKDTNISNNLYGFLVEEIGSKNINLNEEYYALASPLDDLEYTINSELDFGESLHIYGQVRLLKKLSC